MIFGQLRPKSVNIGHFLEKIGRLPEKSIDLPLAVVIMTTASGMHPVYSGTYPIHSRSIRYIQIISDLCISLSVSSGLLPTYPGVKRSTFYGYYLNITCVDLKNYTVQHWF